MLVLNLGSGRHVLCETGRDIIPSHTAYAHSMQESPRHGVLGMLGSTVLGPEEGF